MREGFAAIPAAIRAINGRLGPQLGSQIVA
jgi:hypothetical protein